MLLLTFAILITMIPMAPLIVSAESNVIEVSKVSDFGEMASWDGLKPVTTAKIVREVHSGTYTLQNDVTLDKSLYIPTGEKVTIILNGYTLSRGCTSKAYYGSVIYNLGELTLGSEDVPTGPILLSTVRQKKEKPRQRRVFTTQQLPSVERQRRKNLKSPSLIKVQR